MLLVTLVRHHLLLKYGNSMLGVVWALLGPLGNVLVLVLVFGYVVRIPLERYWAFLLSGYFAWVFVQHVLGASTGLLRNYSALRRSVAFPNEVVVGGASGARLVEFVVELVIVMGVLAIFHHGSLPASFSVVPLLVLVQTVMVVGLTLPLATIALLYHDVEHALPVALGFLFYLSPVFYPASMVPEAFRGLYMLNPLAGLLTLYHQALYEGRFPSWGLFALTLGMATLVFVIGYRYFEGHRDVLPEIA